MVLRVCGEDRDCRFLRSTIGQESHMAIESDAVHSYQVRRKAFNMVISRLEQRAAVDATNNEALEQLGVVGVVRAIFILAFDFSS
ncbi:protein GAMETE EXPRESSED 3 [Canna indica]|uniref:Protein GAMETE EXPRESSED 3 n=1 Tax=Canna indica TaxID=4628 RepID=A0AAQ3JTL7_9LILI|nr:protein GAMETE EXPRESSED 3 [Canna indica]